MPTAAISQIAVLRLYGDMYESRIVVLDALYTKMSPGGSVIIDDYGMIPLAIKPANITKPLSADYS